MGYPKLPVDPRKGTILRVLLTLAAITALGIGLTHDLDYPEKIVLSRYIMFLQAGILAFITPWIMFPQNPIWLSQMMNPGSDGLFRLIMNRLWQLWFVLVVFMTTIVFWNSSLSDPAGGIYLWIDGILFTTGICFFAASRFLKIGAVSQLWQEGERGKKVLDYMKEAGNGPGVPAGSLPTIGTTGVVAVAGMAAVILGAWIQSVFRLPFGSVGGLLLLIIGLFSWRRRFKRLDVDFYHTHGFYNELFRNPAGRADAGRQPIPIESLYWVPGSIKPQLWLTLRQMDRKIPVGRLIILSFLFYWSLIYGGFLSLNLMIIFPALIILIKNMVTLRMDDSPYASAAYRRQLATESGWFWVRTFIGIRWMIPIHLFLAVTIWFVQDLDTGWWQWWFITDLTSLLLLNLFASAKNHLKNTRQYA